MAVDPRRMAAHIEGDFVVFLIGMRINKPWKIHKWLPVARAMPRMLKELSANPELGLLGVELLSPRLIVQYWRSFDHLETYARSQEAQHLPAWQAFNRSLARSRDDVGIWHETYLVRAGEYEAVYSGMPPFGLGRAAGLEEAGGSLESARGRLRSGAQSLRPAGARSDSPPL